ncbi:MAG: nucleotidyltransferase domain-containing protein [Pseudomonadota bacterium]
MIPQQVKRELLDCLKDSKLHRIILFGSYADQCEHPESDIDLLIVSEIEVVNKTYESHLKHKNAISRKLIPLKKRYPIDIIVYTKDEWKLLNAYNTSFIKAISERGIDLL